jgi:hypothetical protein
VENERLARVGIVLEIGIALTQALAALWFYRLFRSVDAFAAGAIAVFGVANAVVILSSAAVVATALEVSLDPVDGGASKAQLMYIVSDNLWEVGALFFGLWLIPMGWCVLRSRWMPRLLGWVLVVGGAGYVLSAFVAYLVPDGWHRCGRTDFPRHSRRILDDRQSARPGRQSTRTRPVGMSLPDGWHGSDGTGRREQPELGRGRDRNLVHLDRLSLLRRSSASSRGVPRGLVELLAGVSGESLADPRQVDQPARRARTACSSLERSSSSSHWPPLPGVSAWTNLPSPAILAITPLAVLVAECRRPRCRCP